MNIGNAFIRQPLPSKVRTKSMQFLPINIPTKTKPNHFHFGDEYKYNNRIIRGRLLIGFGVCLGAAVDDDPVGHPRRRDFAADYRR